MKHTRLALVLVATSLATTPAIAASLTMLQFGSFETRAEAEKRLSDITKKHGAAVSQLGSTIREVKLPPDNLTVYRTQAGPVENRAAAQAICATLASAGDECYIVQTAMVASADVVKPAVPVEAAASATVENVKTDLAQAAPLKDDLTSKLSTLSEPTVRDASNVKALESITAPKIETPMAEMKTALDKAASEQAAAETSVKNATDGIGQKPRVSFWSRLNPFAADEKKAKPVAAVKVPEPVAAPVEGVTAQAIEAPVVVAAPVIETPPAPMASTVVTPALAAENSQLPPITNLAAAPVSPQPMLPVNPVMPTESSATMDSSSVIMHAEPLRLPPPPAPLKARDRELLAATRDGQTAMPPTMPTQIGNLSPIDVKPLPLGGTVQVEEAKRVPVTSATIVPPQLSNHAATPVVSTAQPAVPLNPSATDGMKTIWAQIGPFADNDAALAYWANYRQTNPDFPVVRVRVTTPLAQQVRGSSQSWLRVGPVTRSGFVKSLCASVLTPAGKLRCGTVTDMGVSSSTSATGMLPSSRYSR